MAISRWFRAVVPVALATAPLAAQAPPLDQALAADAEVRVALFELLADRPVAALSRLRAARSSPEMQVDGVAGGFGQSEIQFLLAQSYARLGMGSAFRGTAQELLARGSTRYAPMLRLQLLLDAYRRGAYQEAVTLYGDAGGAEHRGVAGLIGGLAHYRTGAYAPARAAFDASAAAGGVYAGFARYMSALAQIAGDTAQAQAGLASLQALSGDALGEFADQVNLTIAQLAYQRGDWAAAAAAAQRVSADGGLHAQATLTRAWAQYKSSQLDAAAQAFTEFASRYPQLPQRDEARLMIGQVRLDQGRIDDAGRHFQSIADSLTSEVTMLRQGSAAAMADAARAFVQARAASLLFLQQPSAGKTLAVPDEFGLDPASLARALGAAVPPTPVEQQRPELVTMADIAPRLDSLTPATSGYTRRVVYVTDSGGATLAEFTRRTQTLREADVAVALARYRLAEQLASHDSKLALIERLQAMLGEAAARLDTMSVSLGQSRDSLQRLAAAAEEERVGLRQLLQREAEAVRSEAAENVRRTDSLRASLRGALTAEDSSLMAIERQTALTYQQLADNVLTGVDRAFARHPVMRLQDTIRRHIAESDTLVLATRAAISTANDVLGTEIDRMRASESERTRAARAAVAAAEAARASAESGVLAAVEAELRARAATLLALVRRDVEAAEFGAASASFFKAVGVTPADANPGGSPDNASGSPDRSSPR